ncbi:MAG: RNA polymerase-binding protein DksA [Desulfotalea sp.]
MEQNVIDDFRQQLLAKRQDILDDVEKTLGDMTNQVTNIPDPNDRATTESARSFEIRIREREQKLLAKIDEALLRIDDEEFGECEGCGEDIGVNRLQARPVTTLCIDCKTIQENTEKSTAS